MMDRRGFMGALGALGAWVGLGRGLVAEEPAHDAEGMGALESSREVVLARDGAFLPHCTMEVQDCLTVRDRFIYSVVVNGVAGFQLVKVTRSVRFWRRDWRDGRRGLLAGPWSSPEPLPLPSFATPSSLYWIDRRFPDGAHAVEVSFRASFVELTDPEGPRRYMQVQSPRMDREDRP